MGNTEDLIGKLCGELEPTKRRCPYRYIAAWMIFSLAYILGVVGYYGPKIDLAEHLTNAAFLFEMAITAGIFVFAAIASSFLSFPDETQRGWIKTVAVTLFLVFTTWILVNAVEEGLDFSLFKFGSCYKGLFVEAIPFVALIFLTARGYSTQPYWLMTMNVLAVSALGWVGLRLTCSMYDSMIYGFLHYLLPFTILGAAIGFFARKIFKW